MSALIWIAVGAAAPLWWGMARALGIVLLDLIGRAFGVTVVALGPKTRRDRRAAIAATIYTGRKVWMIGFGDVALSVTIGGRAIDRSSEERLAAYNALLPKVDIAEAVKIPRKKAGQ